MLVTALKPFNHSKDGFTSQFVAKGGEADVDPKLIQRLVDEGFVTDPGTPLPPAPPKPDSFKPGEAAPAGGADAPAADAPAADAAATAPAADDKAKK